MVGGGVPKNFAQDTVVCAEILGVEAEMHKYAVQITVADVRDGACSSSTLKEAASWGKVHTTYEQMVFAEATTVVPLIGSDAYHRGAGRTARSAAGPSCSPRREAVIVGLWHGPAIFLRIEPCVSAEHFSDWPSSCRLGGASVAQQNRARPAGRADRLSDRGHGALAGLILPPEPKEGSDRFAQDRAIFRATRFLEGSERWKLAQNDNLLTPPDLMRDFSCSVGVTLTPQSAPKTLALLRRVALDSGRVASGGKNVFKRKRPFHYDEGNICIPQTDALDASLDYPSGHYDPGLDGRPDPGRTRP